MSKGRLWGIAENQLELEEWKKEWEGKPIEIVETNTTGHQDSERINVIYELDKNSASDLLGYEVDEEEWLESED